MSAKVPFDSRGNMLPRDSGTAPAWRELKPFIARLKVVGVERKRSSVVFWVQDESGKKYPMGVQDLVGALKGTELTGSFTAKKNGNGYSLVKVT